MIFGLCAVIVGQNLFKFVDPEPVFRPFFGKVWNSVAILQAIAGFLSEFNGKKSGKLSQILSLFTNFLKTALKSFLQQMLQIKMMKNRATLNSLMEKWSI